MNSISPFILHSKTALVPKKKKNSSVECSQRAWVCAVVVDKKSCYLLSIFTVFVFLVLFLPFLLVFRMHWIFSFQPQWIFNIWFVYEIICSEFRFNFSFYNVFIIFLLFILTFSVIKFVKKKISFNQSKK